MSCPCDIERCRVGTQYYRQTAHKQPHKGKFSMCVNCGFYWGVKE